MAPGRADSQETAVSDGSPESSVADSASTGGVKRRDRADQLRRLFRLPPDEVLSLIKSRRMCTTSLRLGRESLLHGLHNFSASTIFPMTTWLGSRSGYTPSSSRSLLSIGACATLQILSAPPYVALCSVWWMTSSAPSGGGCSTRAASTSLSTMLASTLKFSTIRSSW